jgi:hypothetical protein
MSLFRARYADGERLDIDGLSVRLSVNPRARHISVRIDRTRREAVAVSPSARRLADTVAFARRRAGWMRQRLAEIPAPAPLAFEREIQVFGRPCRLTPDGRRPRLVQSPGEERLSLAGCGQGEIDAQLVVRALKSEARRVFADRIGRHCQVLGIAAAPKLSVTDTRSRWGSCTKARAGAPASIRLSWRLALAPFAVADYVAAHECGHLIEANHGPRFWALVRDLIGDPRPHRSWLRLHGPHLHALR